MTAPPFPPFPCSSRYVATGTVQEAFDRVCRAISGRETVSMVIGPPGCGKSLLCRLIADQFAATHTVIQLGDAELSDSQSLLRHVLHRMGIDPTNQADLQLALIDQITSPISTNDGLVLIVDEAQRLSPEVLESIRIVTNIMQDGQPRALAVICGGVKLEETLVQPSLDALAQRVATRCYLHPLSFDETRQYITETIASCGADAHDTVTDGAIQSVFHACDGIPRLINQLMTQAIDVAADRDQVQITEEIVETAWAQLQQLPSPMVDEPKLAAIGNEVEFGELDDPGIFEPEDSETDHVDDAEAIDVPLPNTSIVFDQDAGISLDVESAQWLDSSSEDTSTDLATEPSNDATETESHSRIVPENVFGEFEVEEEVMVGDVQISHDSDRSVSADELLPVGESACEPDVDRSGLVTVDVDLASILHQEVILATTEASGDYAVTHGCQDLPIDQCENANTQVELKFDSTAESVTDQTSESTMTDDDSDDPYVEEPHKEVVDDFIADSENQLTDECEEEIDIRTPPVMRVVSEAPSPVHQANDENEMRRAATQQDDAGPCQDDRDILVIEDALELQAHDRETRIDGHEQTISVDFQSMLQRMRNVPS